MIEKYFDIVSSNVKVNHFGRPIAQVISVNLIFWKGLEIPDASAWDLIGNKWERFFVCSKKSTYI